MSTEGARSGRLLATAVAGLFAATALVQTGNAFPTWDRDVASGLLLSAACVLVGAAIASRRAARAFGWTLVAIGGIGAAAALALALPESGALRSIGSWAWVVPPRWPRSRCCCSRPASCPRRRWSGALAAALLAPPCLALAAALEDDAWGPAARAAVVLAGVALALSLAALASRLRHPCELVRRRVLCLALGGLVALLALALDAICLPGARAVGAFALPAAAGIALLRDQLYDLDLTLNRSLVAGGLTLCLLGRLRGQRLDRARRRRCPFSRRRLLAIGLDPLRRRMQHAVDHVLYGRQHDPYAVMTALGRHVDTSEPADGRTALADVAATIAQSLALPYVAIELASDGGGEPTAAWGRPAAATVALELCHRGERVGTLRVVPHTIGGTVVAEELRLLEDLARQVAVTAHVVQLSQGLQRSREALVTAREEERRRLRRDLHDGLGPTLAAMTMRIDVALSCSSATRPRSRSC